MRDPSRIPRTKLTERIRKHTTPVTDNTDSSLDDTSSSITGTTGHAMCDKE